MIAALARTMIWLGRMNGFAARTACSGRRGRY